MRDFYKAVKDTCAGTFINGMCLGEWSTMSPTLYVWMRVLWNPDVDVDAVLDEMCRGLFGKAANTARQLMSVECKVWEKGKRPHQATRRMARAQKAIPHRLRPGCGAATEIAALQSAGRTGG